MFLLQLVGGGLYLLNKIFFSISERWKSKGRTDQARQWRIFSWVVYLAGLGPIVAMFCLKHNWIAASVETSGMPSMALGLVTALRTGKQQMAPRWLDILAAICIIVGFVVSICDFGGLRKLTQWLEIGLVTGFLIGTYQLAKERRSGYIWFMLMNTACAWLMWVQHLHLMFWQQVVSFGFIIDAHQSSRQAETLEGGNP